MKILLYIDIFLEHFTTFIFNQLNAIDKNVEVKVICRIRQNELYDFIELNQSVSIKILTKSFNAVTQRTVERWIKQLKDEGKIEFIGAAKTGGYYVKF